MIRVLVTFCMLVLLTPGASIAYQGWPYSLAMFLPLAVVAGFILYIYMKSGDK